MDRLWPLLLLLCTLAPMAVRLGIARSARRRVHVLDDVICYLGMPLLFLPILFPLPPVVSHLCLGTGLALSVVSIWRTLREYRLARRAELTSGERQGGQR